MVDATAAADPFFPEAAPDVEVFLRITGRPEVDCEMKVACINISRTTADLKNSLSACLDIALENMELWKGNTQLQDNVTLVDYDISQDDTLEVRVTTH